MSTKSELYLVDHGRNCGNAIRFEIQDSDGNLIASLEDENERNAGKLAAALVHRYNLHDELVAFVRECATDRDDRLSPGLLIKSRAVLAKASQSV